MAARRPEHLVIVVGPGPRARTLLGWLRQLFPAALLLVASPTLLPPLPDAEVVTLDADEVADAGPLSLADAVARGRGEVPPGRE